MWSVISVTSRIVCSAHSWSGAGGSLRRGGDRRVAAAVGFGPVPWGRERVEAFAAELAVVLGEAWAGELPASSRRLGSVMVDRAWGRVRAAERKGRWLQPVELDETVERLAGGVPSPEETVVTRVTVGEFRRSLAAHDDDEVSVMVLRAWDTAAELVDRVDRSQRDRNRWRYARLVLRRRVSPDLELLADVV